MIADGESKDVFPAVRVQIEKLMQLEWKSDLYIKGIGPWIGVIGIAPADMRGDGQQRQERPLVEPAKLLPGEKLRRERGGRDQQSVRAGQGCAGGEKRGVRCEGRVVRFLHQPYAAPDCQREIERILETAHGPVRNRRERRAKNGRQHVEGRASPAQRGEELGRAERDRDRQQEAEDFADDENVAE